MDSILTSIKKVLGITQEYEHFDTDIIMHINSALSVLTQIGVGPSKGFRVTSKDDLWNDFIPDDDRLECAKSFIHLKVRLLFDPPTSSAVIESMNRMIGEFEWRLQVATDPVNSKKEEIQNE